LLLVALLTVSAPVATSADPALDAFRNSQAWATLPPALLSVLAARLRTVENVREFMQLVEAADLLQQSIRPLVALRQDIRPLVADGHGPDFLVGAISSVLTSYGNAAGERQQLDSARRAFSLALLLNPRNPSALFSLGLIHTISRNCGEAARALDQLIALKPQPNSADSWEGGLADLEKSGMLAELKRNAADVRLQCQQR
jgi:tetratricopeptide (TPR) repeat protein